MNRKEMLKEQTSKSIRENLTPEEVQQVQKIGVYKFLTTFRTLYNYLCRQCKAKVLQDPRGMNDLNKFCETCKPMVKKQMEALTNNEQPNN